MPHHAVAGIRRINGYRCGLLLALALAISGCSPPRVPEAPAVVGGPAANTRLPVPPPAAGKRLPSLAPMLSKVIPGVVNISTTTRVRVALHPLLADPFLRQFFRIPNIPAEQQRQSLGSGIIVDARSGYVLTNRHVVANADRVAVTLADGRRFDARLVGADRDSDIALIHIPADGLVGVPLGNSDALEVGDFVVAIGNPFGLGQSVTSGIVSALGRHVSDGQRRSDFIQTDASINPGSSGGALVNLRGEVVGVNTAIIGSSGVNVGISFAVPVNRARAVIARWIGR